MIICLFFSVIRPRQSCLKDWKLLLIVVGEVAFFVSEKRYFSFILMLFCLGWLWKPVQGFKFWLQLILFWCFFPFSWPISSKWDAFSNLDKEKNYWAACVCRLQLALVGKNIRRLKLHSPTTKVSVNSNCVRVMFWKYRARS